MYVFASLELRRAVFENGDYADTKDTEVSYLFAHGVRVARLHYSEDSLPTLTSGKLHVLLELPDHLGSSSIVIDKETGELAERSTYQAYGGADSDYRPDRWGSFREDYKFTGKEEDSEVGLDYFGKRYLAVGLNRWLSADPLAVHSPGKADLNLYAYVAGHALMAVDPVGLDASITITPTTIVVKTHMDVPRSLSDIEIQKLEKILDNFWNAQQWATKDSETGQVRSVRFEFSLSRQNLWEAVKSSATDRAKDRWIGGGQRNQWDRLAGRSQENRVRLSDAAEYGKTPSGNVALGRTDDGKVANVSRASINTDPHRFAHETGHVMGLRDEPMAGGLGMVGIVSAPLNLDPHSQPSGGVSQPVVSPLMSCNAASGSADQFAVTQSEVDKIASLGTQQHNWKVGHSSDPANVQGLTTSDTVTVKGAEGSAECK